MPKTKADCGVDQVVEEVRRGTAALGTFGIPQRVSLIDRLRRDTLAVADDWVRAGCEAKGLDPASGAAAEEWLGGPTTVLRNLRLLRDTLTGLARTGRPALKRGEVARRGGRTVVRVFPGGLDDRLVLGGYRAEVRMEEGLSPEDVEGTMARAYLGTPEETSPALCALLGAGNVSGIALQDFLHKLIGENHACVLKTNPVNEYLAPFYERAFAGAIEADLLRVLPGGADVGAELVHHEGVDEVHITGSTAVHDAIVWGGPEVREDNRRRGQRVLSKPITSELGCVTPVILTPGKWTAKELEHQAWNVASMVVNNASFNCNSAKVLVTARDWPQREVFLETLAGILGAIPTRLAYYPGAEARHAAFCDAHSDVRLCGEAQEGHLPWALATGLASDEPDGTAFENEPWCGVLAETALDTADPDSFLAAATRFCNEELFGTLSCCLVVDPRTAKSHGAAYEAALAELRYGSVVVNHWPALSYGLGVTPWGAHVGHTLEDIQSGIGFVHNTRLFSRMEKCVVEGAFVPGVKPLWFVNHRRAREAAAAMARFEAQPGPGALFAVARNGLAG
ncbi:MAG: aldehyde dehydrogenase family protein [Planctomycetota bacterium]|jgi:aldehyde dehydrogenase (NAD(P)+)|nr:aldehyde dehydrogenase [Planctomycetota bacterium]MDP6520828.1 aldehyde dehydrogenase family protein [Planctomycetota bacterium]MDP6838201.1 aldehyde dehydrogenase family protein [Planctomycetota bacterium]MDP6956362.1 aldehyde dehydrogenase family protein [Planctomycetota bacterium]